MRKALLAVAVACTLSVTFGAQAQDTPDGYQLEQVLIMSRHNLRAPLANNGSVLEQSTPKQWPGGTSRVDSSPPKVAYWKCIWVTICASGWQSRGW